MGGVLFRVHHNARDRSAEEKAESKFFGKGVCLWYDESRRVVIPTKIGLTSVIRVAQSVAHEFQSIRIGHPVSIATHDESLIQTVLERGYLHEPHVELEMLYGIRTDLAARLRTAGITIRIYLTYGTEWYLYLCHRIAEYPPNLYAAITDMITGNVNHAETY